MYTIDIGIKILGRIDYNFKYQIKKHFFNLMLCLFKLNYNKNN